MTVSKETHTVKLFVVNMFFVTSVGGRIIDNTDPQRCKDSGQTGQHNAALKIICACKCTLPVLFYAMTLNERRSHILSFQ